MTARCHKECKSLDFMHLVQPLTLRGGKCDRLSYIYFHYLHLPSANLTLPDGPDPCVSRVFLGPSSFPLLWKSFPLGEVA